MSQWLQGTLGDSPRESVCVDGREDARRRGRLKLAKACKTCKTFFTAFQRGHYHWHFIRSGADGTETFTALKAST